MDSQPLLRYLLVIPIYKQISVNAVIDKLMSKSKDLYHIDRPCSRFGSHPPSHFFCPSLSQEAFDTATIVLDSNLSHCYWCSFFDGDFVWDTNAAQCAGMIGDKMSDREFLKHVGLKPITK